MVVHAWRQLGTRRPKPLVGSLESGGQLDRIEGLGI